MCIYKAQICERRTSGPGYQTYQGISSGGPYVVPSCSTACIVGTYVSLIMLLIVSACLPCQLTNSTAIDSCEGGWRSRVTDAREPVTRKVVGSSVLRIAMNSSHSASGTTPCACMSACCLAPVATADRSVLPQAASSDLPCSTPRSAR